MALSGAKKFSVGHHHLTCVFVSLLRIISIRKNKREGLTILQSPSKNANVRRRWFFKFHTHPVRDSKGSCNHQYDSHLQKTLHFEFSMAVKFFEVNRDLVHKIGPFLHPQEVSKKFWGHYDENFARHWEKTYPPSRKSTFGNAAFIC